MYIIDDNQNAVQEESTPVRSTNPVDVNKHFNILGLLYILVNALIFIPAAIVFFVLLGAGILSQEPMTFAITTTIGTFVAIMLIVLALPGIIGGWGLINDKLWAKYVILVLGVLNLFSFPFGTLLGAYTIWVMTRPEAGVMGETGAEASSELHSERA